MRGRFGLTTCLVSLAFVLQGEVSGRPVCRSPNDNGEVINGVCQKCPVCDRGEGHSKRCEYGDGAGATCVPCKEGVEFSHDSQCWECNNCTRFYRETKYRCRPSINAECGECLPDYFDAYNIGGVCSHCAADRKSHPKCAAYRARSQVTPTPQVTPSLLSRMEPQREKDPVSYQHDSSTRVQNEHGQTPTNGSNSGEQKSDLSVWGIVAIALAIVILVVVFIIVAVMFYRRRKKKLSLNYSDVAKTDPEKPDPDHAIVPQEVLENRAADHVELTKRKVSFKRQISEPVTDTEKNSVSHNPKLEDLLVREQKQGAEPSINSTSDLLNQSDRSAGRRPSENIDACQYRQPPASPIGQQQNSPGRFNFSSSPGDGQNRLNDSVEQYVSTPESRVEVRSRRRHSSRGQNHLPYKDFVRNEKALRIGSRIKVKELSQDLQEDLEMLLKVTDIAGVKNFRHVVDELKLPSIGAVVKSTNSLKGMKDVIFHMGTSKLKLDVLMKCVDKLKRDDVLEVLVDYCLSHDDREDEDDIGGPGVQETGDDKEEMAVPAPEPSAATKLLS